MKEQTFNRMTGFTPGNGSTPCNDQHYYWKDERRSVTEGSNKQLAGSRTHICVCECVWVCLCVWECVCVSACLRGDMLIGKQTTHGLVIMKVALMVFLRRWHLRHFYEGGTNVVFMKLALMLFLSIDGTNVIFLGIGGTYFYLVVGSSNIVVAVALTLSGPYVGSQKVAASRIG